MPGFLATLCVSPADGIGGIALANATSGPDIAAIAIDLVAIVADHEPRVPARWKPLPEVDQALLALTGLWYWGPRPYVLRLLADRGLELSPAAGKGRAPSGPRGLAGVLAGTRDLPAGADQAGLAGVDDRLEPVAEAELGEYVGAEWRGSGSGWCA